MVKTADTVAPARFQTFDSLDPSTVTWQTWYGIAAAHLFHHAHDDREMAMPYLPHDWPASLADPRNKIARDAYMQACSDTGVEPEIA